MHRRGPPALQSHPGRAVRRPGLCVRTVLASASNCDAATAPSACPLARRLGRAAVAVWLRGTAAIRKLLRRPRRDIDRETDRRRLDAELADARHRRTEQTRERLTKAERETKLRYKQAYAAWCFEDGGLVSWSSSPALD